MYDQFKEVIKNIELNELCLLAKVKNITYTGRINYIVNIINKKFILCNYLLKYLGAKQNKKNEYILNETDLIYIRHYLNRMYVIEL